jgi:hypothetical protein
VLWNGRGMAWQGMAWYGICELTAWAWHGGCELAFRQPFLLQFMTSVHIWVILCIALERQKCDSLHVSICRYKEIDFLALPHVTLHRQILEHLISVRNAVAYM